MTTSPTAPAVRDRMAGRYFGQCPTCRTHRHPGPDCAGNGPVPARQRRKQEHQALERYVRDELGTAPLDPLVDESDCQHGCNGLCLRSGSDRCDFTCHPSWSEMFPGRLVEGHGRREAR